MDLDSPSQGSNHRLLASQSYSPPQPAVTRRDAVARIPPAFCVKFNGKVSELRIRMDGGNATEALRWRAQRIGALPDEERVDTHADMLTEVDELQPPEARGGILKRDSLMHPTPTKPRRGRLFLMLKPTMLVHRQTPKPHYRSLS